MNPQKKNQEEFKKKEKPHDKDESTPFEPSASSTGILQTQQRSPEATSSTSITAETKLEVEKLTSISLQKPSKRKRTLSESDVEIVNLELPPLRYQTFTLETETSSASTSSTSHKTLSSDLQYPFSPLKRQRFEKLQHTRSRSLPGSPCKTGSIDKRIHLQRQKHISSKEKMSSEISVLEEPGSSGKIVEKSSILPHMYSEPMDTIEDEIVAFNRYIQKKYSIENFRIPGFTSKRSYSAPPIPQAETDVKFEMIKKGKLGKTFIEEESFEEESSFYTETPSTVPSELSLSQPEGNIQSENIQPDVSKWEEATLLAQPGPSTASVDQFSTSPYIHSEPIKIVEGEHPHKVLFDRDIAIRKFAEDPNISKIPSLDNKNCLSGPPYSRKAPYDLMPQDLLTNRAEEIRVLKEDFTVHTGTPSSEQSEGIWSLHSSHRRAAYRTEEAKAFEEDFSVQSETPSSEQSGDIWPSERIRQRAVERWRFLESTSTQTDISCFRVAERGTQTEDLTTEPKQEKTEEEGSPKKLKKIEKILKYTTLYGRDKTKPSSKDKPGPST
ncbi:hypothetical protein PGB90_010260 [Kerria lacca]